MSAYAPFLPSPLSISSSSSPPPQPPSSDPMLPSSPTPKSAPARTGERQRTKDNPRAAAYKSQLSTRRPPPHSSASSSSSSSSPTPFGSSPSALSNRTRRTAQENSRAARIQVLQRHSSRGLPLLTTLGGDVGGEVRDEPGGWVDGEWEEFDDDEKVGLELEMRKARREFEWRQRKLDELASEQGFPLEEEPEDDMMEPGKLILDLAIPALEVKCRPDRCAAIPAEPPLDVLLEDEPPLHSLPEHYASATEDIGSSPLAGVGSGGKEVGGYAEDDLAAFDHALVSSPFCPACGATDSPLGGDANVGLRCTGQRNGQPGCGWGIEMPVLAPLRQAFAAHG